RVAAAVGGLPLDACNQEERGAARGGGERNQSIRAKCHRERQDIALHGFCGTIAMGTFASTQPPFGAGKAAVRNAIAAHCATCGGATPVHFESHPLPPAGPTPTVVVPFCVAPPSGFTSGGGGGGTSSSRGFGGGELVRADGVAVGIVATGSGFESTNFQTTMP